MITLNGGVSNYVRIEGRRYSYFSGNDYLGLSSHPDLKKAACESIEKHGLNFAAARQTTGTAAIHLELEKVLSEFKHQDDTVVFASGYLGNGILLQAIGDRYDAVFTDEAAHPSILDGIPRDKQIQTFNHRDLQHLDELLGNYRHGHPLIITDGIFALTGEIAPLDGMHSLAQKYGAILVVDDAHATGVLGETGTGTPEHFQLRDSGSIFQTDTMSKAMGVYGGFISASKAVTQRIRKISRSYLASTALPPPIVSAACASVRLIRQEPGLRNLLFRNAGLVRKGIEDLGLPTAGGETPIIPIVFKSPEKAQAFSEYLKKDGIIVSSVRYPVGKDKFVARITVSAKHTLDQIEELLALVRQWSREQGIN
jgi:7-keto-8-aminopelargonate synthetase-like enzyme